MFVLTDKQLKDWGKKRRSKLKRIRRQYRKDQRAYAQVIKQYGPRPNDSLIWGQVFDTVFERQ